MKKSIMGFSFVLAFVLLFSLFFTNGAFNTKSVHALSRFDGQRIVVVGKGEVEAEPDTVKVSFGLKTRADSLSSGQTKIRDNIDEVSNKIKEYDANAEVYTNYLSSYPVFENGLLAYEFDCCLIAKSNKVEDANGLVDAVVNAGATSVHSIRYLLSDKEDAYIKALVSAKENAESKVKAIYDNATLKGLKEEVVYNYCEGNRGEKIKICAKVNACYEINNSEVKEAVIKDVNSTAQTNADETKVEKAESVKSNALESELKEENNTPIKSDKMRRENETSVVNSEVSTLEEKAIA